MLDYENIHVLLEDSVFADMRHSRRWRVKERALIRLHTPWTLFFLIWKSLLSSIHIKSGKQSVNEKPLLTTNCYWRKKYYPGLNGNQELIKIQ